MPRKVDHDERRLQVARVVQELVHEGGAEGLTIRDVAKRAGCSTSVVSHYFANKLELFLFTHRMVRTGAEARLWDRLKAGDDLVTSLSTVLPIDEGVKRDWHTWFAFWGVAPAEPAINEEWLAGTTGAHDVFTALLEAAHARGEIARPIHPVHDASRVQIVINGIASLVLQDERSWPPERQLEELRAMLDMIFRPAQ